MSLLFKGIPRRRSINSFPSRLGIYSSAFCGDVSASPQRRPSTGRLSLALLTSFIAPGNLISRQANQEFSFIAASESQTWRKSIPGNWEKCATLELGVRAARTPYLLPPIEFDYEPGARRHDHSGSHRH